MTSGRSATLLLLIAVVCTGYVAVDKKVDRAVGRTPQHQNVIVAERKAASPAKRASNSRPGFVARLMMLPPYRSYLNRRIQATSLRIQASLAQDPDNFDARDRLWQRLHRLQTRRDAA